MSLQELHKQPAAITEKHTKKTVTVFVDTNFYVLSGKWEWQLNSDTVFCSDVILSLPPAIEGTNGIIHPDDVALLKKISKEKIKIDHLQFRIITSYGEVKILSCNDLLVEKAEAIEDFLEASVLKQATDELEIKKDYEHLQLQKEIYDRAEKFTGTGIWYYNSATKETWYSSNIFRLYNLPPQSLNAHLNTFNSFIHPEDKEQVIEFTAKAFKQRAPLHMQYRVLTTAGEKLLFSATHWFFSTKGEEILSGTLQDITEQRNWEQNLDESGNTISFFKQQLMMDEQYSRTAHWQVHLLTRKTIFSDNYYRIFGLKPQSVPPGTRNFINYIHPDDRDFVAAANKKMIYEHLVPEIDYRIVRSDGKLRYISQKAKLIAYGNELVIAGVIQDVTVQKMLEKKIADISEKEAVRNFASKGTEDMTGAASWVWEINTGEITWSDNFYKLLGYKPGAVELSQKLLLAYIHPEDQKKFKDHQNLVLQQNQDSEFEFRLVYRGNVKYMKASFRMMQTKEANLFMATVQDITKETILQKQLQQRMQLAEALSENILDRIIITDINNNILFWNSECERVYGIKKDDAVGTNFFDVFPQLKTETELQLFAKVLKGEKIATQISKSYLGKGFYNLHMVPLWDEEKTEVNGIIHIIHDVTKEVELRQDLSEQLNFIERLLEASVDRIIALDNNMNYIYWNKKAEEYYDVKKEEVIGKNILEIFPGLINDPSYGEFRKALKGETVHIPAGKNSEGRNGYFETYLIPIKDDEDEVAGVLWMVHDLAKEFELQIQHVKEHELLEALNENYYELDSDYRISYVNQNGLQFLNSKREDVVGKLIWEAFPKVLNTPFYEAIKKAMEEGVSTRTEIKSPTMDTWMNVSIAPTADGVVILAFDIDKLKTTREQSEQNKNILEAVFNASLHGLILFKTVRNEKEEIVDFEVVMNNEVTKKWNGRTLAGERYAELFPGIKQNGIFDGFKKVVESGEPLNMEVHYEEEGSNKWFCITAVKLEDGLVSTAEDITARKKAEAELNNTLSCLALQNKVYGYAEDIANMGTWTWNMDTNKAQYSDKMFLLFGMKPQEVEPNFETIPKFIHPDDRQRLLKHAEALKEEQKVVDVEYRVIRKDGIERVFRNRIKLTRNEIGERLIIGTTQDITEELELRKRVQESTQYAEKIIDASINRIYAIDSQMNIIAWNKRSEEITGVKKEDALGRNVFDLFPKLEQDEVIRKAYEDALAGNYVHLEPKRSIYSQGIYERFFIPLKNDHGKTSAVVNILLDVSVLVEKEEELKELNKTLEEKNKELEDKNEEITSFAFVASHDLKEPLRKIHTFSDWLLVKESDKLGERGKEYLARMNASVKRLNMLIDDILVLTKVHSDTQQTNDVDLNLVYKLVKDDLAEAIKKTNAVITVEQLPVIRANKNQLGYLFRNLLDNALTFQPKGQQPVIHISSEIIEKPSQLNLSLKEGKEYLKLSFSDNGIGFDRRYKGKIFRVFQQLKDIPHNGTGMGLTICKKVMENHRGIITAESEPGKGSLFCCYFPL
jgi:PAS domain S-box-containing protein